MLPNRRLKLPGPTFRGSVGLPASQQIPQVGRLRPPPFAPQLRRDPLGGTSAMSKSCPSIALLVLLSACAPNSGAEFRGLWIVEGEDVAFQPCGTSERWFATFDSALLKEAVVETTMVFIGSGADTASVKRPPLPPPKFIVLRGDTSPAGSYGPSGDFRRRLVVHALGDTTGKCP